MDLLDHKSIIRGLSFTSDGSLQLISCSNDCTLKFWDLNEDGNMCRTLKFENRGMIFGCKWSPNCKQVAAVGTMKNVSSFLPPCIRTSGGSSVQVKIKYQGHILKKKWLLQAQLVLTLYYTVLTF